MNDKLECPHIGRWSEYACLTCWREDRAEIERLKSVWEQSEDDRTDAEEEIERLQGELDRPRHETLRQLADVVERNVQQKAEIERLREESRLSNIAWANSEAERNDMETDRDRYAREANEWQERAEAAEAKLEKLRAVFAAAKDCCTLGPLTGNHAINCPSETHALDCDMDEDCTCGR